MQYNRKKTARHNIQAYFLAEAIGVIGILVIILAITAPLLRNILTEVPRLYAAAQEREQFFGLLDDLRSDIEAASSVNIDNGSVILANIDGSKMIISINDEGKLCQTTLTADGTSSTVVAADIYRTVVELLPFPAESKVPLAVNLRISDVSNLQPLELKNQFNTLIFLKEGQYATQK